MSQGQNREHFDMLPFIAILMCTLGGLLYVTMIVAALFLGPGATEIWVPDDRPGPAAKQPVLIEWDGRVATVHHGDGKVVAPWDGQRSVAVQPDGSLALVVDEASPLGRTIAELARGRARQYALFAVRPSGFATFNRLADAFRQQKVDIGYAPVDQDRPVLLGRVRPRS
jgi:hypothetical protein